MRAEDLQGVVVFVACDCGEIVTVEYSEEEQG